MPLAHAPNAFVEKIERTGFVAQLDGKQSDMPPIVRQHERRTAIPVPGMGMKEGATLDRLFHRSHSMRRGMLCPGISTGVEFDGAPREAAGKLRIASLLHRKGVKAKCMA